MLNENNNKKSIIKLPSILGLNQIKTTLVLSMILFFTVSVANLTFEKYTLPDVIKEQLGSVYTVNITINSIFAFLLLVLIVLLDYVIIKKKGKSRIYSAICNIVLLVLYTVFKIVNYFIVVKKLDLFGGISNGNNYSEDSKKSLNYLFLGYTANTIVLVLYLFFITLYMTQFLNYDDVEDEQRLKTSYKTYLKYVKFLTLFSIIYLCFAIVCEFILFKPLIRQSLIIVICSTDVILILFLIPLYVAVRKYKMSSYNRIDAFKFVSIIYVIIKYTFLNSVIYDDKKDKDDKNEKVKITYNEYINNYNEVLDKFNYRKFIIYLIFMILFAIILLMGLYVSEAESLIKKADQEERNRVENEQIAITTE